MGHGSLVLKSAQEAFQADGDAHAITLPEAHARDAAYKDALHKHLSGDDLGEIDFFVNARRFELMQRLVGQRLARRPLSILNVASGPFAFEFYVPLAGARIVSFDREARLKSLHDELQQKALIAPGSFEVGDISEFQASDVFDVVLANDVFYAPGVDFFACVGELARAVAPGGIMYFDVQDVRAAKIWNAFGKNVTYRRYELGDIRRAVEAEGLVVETVAPSLGIKGGADEFVRRVLWATMKIANNSAFLCRRPK